MEPEQFIEGLGKIISENRSNEPRCKECNYSDVLNNNGLCKRCDALLESNNNTGLTFKQFKYFMDKIIGLKKVENRIDKSLKLLDPDFNKFNLWKSFEIILDLLVASMNDESDTEYSMIHGWYFDGFPIEWWDENNNKYFINGLKELYEYLVENNKGDS